MKPRIWIPKFSPLAGIVPEQVRATLQGRRISVLPDMTQVLQLEEWHHPDVVDAERPSGSERFQQLAQVLPTGNVKRYHSSALPDTH
jgi:hypothetical protein